MPIPHPIPTVQTLIDATLSLVDESSNSDIGVYDDGEGNVIKTTAQTIQYYLQNGAAELCRTCLYYPVTASRSITETEIGAAQFFLRTVMDANGSYVRSAFYVAFGGIQLVMSTSSGLTDQGYLLLTDATGLPAKWFKAGNLAIGLYPAPAALGTLTIQGPGIAPIPSDVSEPIQWCMPDHALFLTYYSAERLAQRNNPENANLAGKVGTWDAAMLQAQQRCAAELAFECPAEYQRYFAGRVPQPQQQGQ